MSMFLKRDLANIRDPSLLNTEVDEFEQNVQLAIPLEVQYACRYWSVHLSCVEHGDETVVRALNKFLMWSLLWWFEAMSLIGSIPIATGSIQMAQRWAVRPFITCSDDLVLNYAHP
jgi:hypothetical protein